ncbi:MAG: rod shape-determining protein MreC [Dehalococcoidia bacterium]|nr:rod shape-determining protein MreC [Dehalococcoidia bacterium]
MVGMRNAAWLSGILVAALVLLALSVLPPAGRLEASMGAAVAPVAGALRAVVRPAADVFLHAGQLHELAAENAELRRRAERDAADLAALREAGVAQAQTTALLSAVGAAVGGDPRRAVPASILARDPAPGREVLLVDRGALEGVRVGQPVLGAGATLVGVVAQVEDHSARVRLLSDRASAIAAVVQASRTPGSLVGTGRGLRLDLVPHGAPIAVGDVVLSSALGGLLPPGLLAGEVTRVASAPQDALETVEVEPLSDFARLEQVLVLIDARPGAALGGALGGTLGSAP